MTEDNYTCRPTVMLSRAISFFPSFREMGVFNLKGKCVPFPAALAEHQAYKTFISKRFSKKDLELNDSGCGVY